MNDSFDFLNAMMALGGVVFLLGSFHYVTGNGSEPIWVAGDAMLMGVMTFMTALSMKYTERKVNANQEA